MENKLHKNRMIKDNVSSSEMEEYVVQVKRCSKVVKGGAG